MCARWIKNNLCEDDREFVIQRLYKQCSINNGTIEFKSLDFETYWFLLSQCMDFSPEIGFDERKHLFSLAFKKAILNQKVTSKEIEEECKKVQAEFLKTPILDYILYTSCSLDKNFKPNNILINQCAFDFNPNIIYDRSSLEDQIQFKIEDMPQLHLHYLPYIVKTQGRSPIDAANKAFEANSFWRSLLNFVINCKRGWEFSVKVEVYNNVVDGPISTIHFPDGRLAHNNYWHVPFCSIKRLYKITDQDIASFKEIETKVHKHLYSSLLKEAFKRYNEALDSTDCGSSTTLLWSILELLMIKRDEKHDKIVERTRFLWSDYRMHEILLNYVRKCRNDTVHDGLSCNPIEVKILKEIVEDVLLFFLNRNTSIDEFHELLDNNPNINEMCKQIEKLQLAINFRKTHEYEI